MTMKRCRIKDPNYQQNDRFLEGRSRIQSMLDLYK